MCFEYSIGRTNQFVKVEYDLTSSTITCVFQSSAENSCHVKYGQCHQKLNLTAERNSTTNKVTLQIKSDRSECYAVTASNGTFAVMVEGSFSTGKYKCTKIQLTVLFSFNNMFICTGHSTNSRSKVAIIIGIVVPVTVLLLILVTIIIIVTTVWVYLRRKAHTPTPHDVTNPTAISFDESSTNEAKDIDKPDSPDRHEMVEQRSQPTSSDKFQELAGYC